MTAFDEAFTILKVEHAFDLMEGHLLQKGKMEDAMELQRMREFVNVNAESADPAKREAAQQMLQHLTEIMSNRRPMPEGMPQMPVGEGGVPSAPAEHPAIGKAFDFLKKNVIGMQATADGTPVQYNMPDPIASMAQRPQVPEMRQGFFGRMKPTGQMNMGGPQTFVPQQNPENPMAGFGEGMEGATGAGIGEMMTPPGAAVERMPHPSPFPDNQVPPKSFAGQGYSVNNSGELTKPYQSMYNDDYKYINTYDHVPLGQEPQGAIVGDSSANTVADAQAGDQFNRQSRQF